MYIILECHGGPDYAIVVVDSRGYNKVFNTKEEALLFAAENCQQGVVIEWHEANGPARYHVKL